MLSGPFFGELSVKIYFLWTNRIPNYSCRGLVDAWWIYFFGLKFIPSIFQQMRSAWINQFLFTSLSCRFYIRFKLLFHKMKRSRCWSLKSGSNYNNLRLRYIWLWGLNRFPYFQIQLMSATLILKSKGFIRGLKLDYW